MVQTKARFLNHSAAFKLSQTVYLRCCQKGEVNIKRLLRAAALRSLWRRVWDSNPRDVAVKLISSLF
jgi:hypothetical protein